MVPLLVLGPTADDPQTRVLDTIFVFIAIYLVLYVLLTVTVVGLVPEDRVRDFPGDEEPGWVNHLYLAVSVSATFGATDVSVRTRAMRRTVMSHAVLAFVFNSVIIVAAISLMLGSRGRPVRRVRNAVRCVRNARPVCH